MAGISESKDGKLFFYENDIRRPINNTDEIEHALNIIDTTITDLNKIYKSMNPKLRRNYALCLIEDFSKTNIERRPRGDAFEYAVKVKNPKMESELKNIDKFYTFNKKEEVEEDFLRSLNLNTNKEETKLENLNTNKEEIKPNKIKNLDSLRYRNKQNLSNHNKRMKKEVKICPIRKILPLSAQAPPDEVHIAGDIAYINKFKLDKKYCHILPKSKIVVKIPTKDKILSLDERNKKAIDAFFFR